ncbi:hypothetical protein BJF85_17290 [Saccharomonospora sp. CUA-673]|uniref:hypothetical protein n=1 Tax=Saccharomonospora sp. CUA-673 TaxID=1904969 RepID=UPI00095E1D25|nr:hypothetical protein [Saccharomonospora sp. CUA-673]OLT46376.1 hypothetical protein BJF85_17290 [Saccharomonospora sp. CUA-673]
MDIVYNLFVVTHLLGMALLVSGIVARWIGSAAEQTGKIMLWGASVQVVTGLALAGISSAGVAGPEPIHMKLGVKLLIAVAVLVLAHILWRRPDANRNIFHALGAATLINVVIASMWV